MVEEDDFKNEFDKTIKFHQDNKKSAFSAAPGFSKNKEEQAKEPVKEVQEKIEKTNLNSEQYNHYVHHINKVK